MTCSKTEKCIHRNMRRRIKEVEKLYVRGLCAGVARWLSALFTNRYVKSIVKMLKTSDSVELAVNSAETR